MTTVVETNKGNPATAAAKPERKRRLFTQGQRRLEVPGMQGEFIRIKGIDYRLYFFRGTPDRIAAAQEGGYEFVTNDEVDLNNLNMGDDALKSGNTDMGTRVSVLASQSGEIGTDGQAVRLYLMKKRRDWYEEDTKEGEKVNDAVVDALTAGIAGGGDPSNRYVDKSRTKLPAMFTKKPQR